MPSGFACGGGHIVLGCSYGVCGFRALGGLLDVWRVSCWGGFDFGGGVCIMKGVRLKR